jgi:hypothetical protein
VRALKSTVVAHTDTPRRDLGAEEDPHTHNSVGKWLLGLHNIKERRHLSLILLLGLRIYTER